MAFKYYEKVATNENCAAGELKIGSFYEEEKGIKKDLRMAAYWYKKSANNENLIAQFNLARMYKNGDGIDKDYNKAFEIFKQLAEKEYSKGISMLAYCYYNGIGTKVDNQKALGTAQYNLANIYENEVILKDIGKAIYWYKKSAKQGYPNAQSKLEKFIQIINI